LPSPLSGVERFEDPVAVLGDDAGVEKHHWAEVEAALVDGEGELLAHAADGTWPAGQEGSQAGGVLAVQGAADPGQERGERAVSVDEEPFRARGVPRAGVHLVGDGKVLLAVALYDIQVFGIQPQLFGPMEHRVGLGWQVTASYGPPTGTDLEAAVGRDALVHLQQAMGGRRFHLVQGEREAQRGQAPRSLGTVNCRLPPGRSIAQDLWIGVGTDAEGVPSRMIL